MDEQAEYIHETPRVGGEEFQVALSEEWLNRPILRGDITQNPITGDYFQVRIENDGTAHYERIQSNFLAESSGSLTTSSNGSILVSIGTVPTWASTPNTYQVWEDNQNYQTIPWTGSPDPIQEKTTKKSFLDLITLTKENDKTKEGNS